MIQTVKRNEQLRKEYHVLPAVLMDAFDEGKAEGEARGKSLGLAEGKSLRLHSKRKARSRSQGKTCRCVYTGGVRRMPNPARITLIVYS